MWRSGSYNIHEWMWWSSELDVSALRLVYFICPNLWTLMVIFHHIIYHSPLPHYAFSLIYRPCFWHCALLCINPVSPNTFSLQCSCYLEDRDRLFGSKCLLESREVKSILCNFFSSRLFFKEFQSWPNVLQWWALKLQSQRQDVYLQHLQKTCTKIPPRHITRQADLQHNSLKCVTLPPFFFLG